MTRPVYMIAGEIRRDWSKIGKGVNYAAKPYLDAMATLVTAADRYGADSGASIIAYGLGNMGSYRGETARRLKAELKALI